MVVLHNGSLASSVALTMATKIHDPRNIQVIIARGMPGMTKMKIEAAFQLAKHLQVPPPFIITEPTKSFFTTAGKIAMEEGHKEVITGLYNKGDSSRVRQDHKFFESVVAMASNRAATLRSPLIDLRYGDLIKKAIDFELPLEHVRDCISETARFCGVCLPCRHRIAEFKLGEFIDYDYEVPVEWNINKEASVELKAWEEEHGF